MTSVHHRFLLGLNTSPLSFSEQHPMGGCRLRPGGYLDLTDCDPYAGLGRMRAPLSGANVLPRYGGIEVRELMRVVDMI